MFLVGELQAYNLKFLFSKMLLFDNQVLKVEMNVLIDTLAQNTLVLFALRDKGTWSFFFHLNVFYFIWIGKCMFWVIYHSSWVINQE